MKKVIYNFLFIINVILSLFLFLFLPIKILKISFNTSVYTSKDLFCVLDTLIVSIAIAISISALIILTIIALSSLKDYIKFIKKITNKECNFLFKILVEKHSKNYLNDTKLDFNTKIDHIKITDPKALSILIRINDIEIPEYLKYQNYLKKIINLKPSNKKEKLQKQNEKGHLIEKIKCTKNQITLDTNKIKSILNDKQKELDHKNFSNEYEQLKKQINKL